MADLRYIVSPAMKLAQAPEEVGGVQVATYVGTKDVFGKVVFGDPVVGLAKAILETEDGRGMWWAVAVGERLHGLN